MNWIVIESFASEIDANIAKGKLEASGLHCRTRLNPMGDVLLATFAIQTGPCDLLVAEKDVEAASALLK